MAWVDFTVLTVDYSVLLSALIILQRLFIHKLQCTDYRQIVAITGAIVYITNSRDQTARAREGRGIDFVGIDQFL